MSTSLTPYYDNTNQTTFVQASASEKITKWIESGLDIACPHKVEVIRKLTPPTSNSNDHVILRVSKTMRNATTSKLATMQVSLDISIPKDTSELDSTEQKALVSELASLLNEATAMEATSANITALIEGRDL